MTVLLGGPWSLSDWTHTPREPPSKASARCLRVRSLPLVLCPHETPPANAFRPRHLRLVSRPPNMSPLVKAKQKHPGTQKVPCG